jgi:hypothetical protein
MSSVRQYNKSVALVILVPLFFLLISGSTLVQADGEEPFVGVIEEILSDRITVKVTQARYSERTVGEQVSLLITTDTTIRDASRKVIPLERLSVAYSVWIKPNTLPNKDVEASIVIEER